jgi:hypothetical protein
MHLIEAPDRSTASAESASECDGRNLVFLVGCPRSGTTWLQRQLACHPRIHTAIESHLFDHIIGPILRRWEYSIDTRNGGMGPAAYYTEEEFFRMIRSFLRALLRPMIEDLRDGEVFLDKTPSHALFLPEIVRLLPRCRIIHLLRDPRDVVASLLAASRSFGSMWAPKDARAAIRMWTEHIWWVRREGRRLPPAQFHEVRYEELLRAPHEALKVCVEFLGLEWSDDEIARAVAANEKSIARSIGGTALYVGGELARNIGPNKRDPDGFVRRGISGSWRADLSLRERFWIWRTARKEMAELGYRWRFLFFV